MWLYLSHYRSSSLEPSFVQMPKVFNCDLGIFRLILIMLTQEWAIPSCRENLRWWNSKLLPEWHYLLYLYLKAFILQNEVLSRTVLSCASDARLVPVPVDPISVHPEFWHSFPGIARSQQAFLVGTAGERTVETILADVWRTHDRWRHYWNG